jgi:periplasmic protein TonB
MQRPGQVRGTIVTRLYLALQRASVLQNPVIDPPRVAAPTFRPVRTRVVAQPALPQSAFMLSDSWGQYKVSKGRSAVGSIVIHGLIIWAIAAISLVPHSIQAVAHPPEHVTLIAPPMDSYTLPVAKQQAGGGGGGGDHEKIEAPKGRLPKAAPQQITPPSIVVHNEHPKLAVEPTVVAPPQIQMAAAMPNIGNPAAPAMPTVASNGTGSGAGIGSGSGGGIGKGAGPGVGEGHGGGIGGGAYRVGGSVLAPKALSTPDPEYTEQAREAKLQGMCVLRLIVGPDGKPRDIHVVRSLGMGLDEKAIAAVSQWAFAPATKDGLPVPVQISVQVMFRLN